MTQQTMTRDAMVEPGPTERPAGVRSAARGAGLLGLLLVAAALRIYGAAVFPYEQDELYTLIESSALWDSPLRPGIEARPLYYLLQHAVLWVIQPSGFALRVLPVLFGVAGVAVTWLAARAVLGRGAALVAGALVAASPWHLHASGMARYWSLVYLLAALFYWRVLRAHETDRPRDYLLALAPLLLGAVTHPTFAFPVAGASAALWLTRRTGRPGWCWPSRAAVRWLWVPAVIFAVAAYTALSLAGRESSVRNFAGRGWTASVRLLPAMVEWMTPTVFAAGGLGALLLWSAGGTPVARRWGAMATLGGLTALVLLFAASLVTDTYADYGIAMLPLVFVSAAGLVQLVLDRLRAGAGAFVAAAAGLLLAATLPSLASYLSDGTRFDYRPAYRAVAAADPRAVVLAWPVVLQRHYAPELNARELRMEPLLLERTLRDVGELWAIVPVQRYGIVGDDGDRAARWLAARCRLADSFERPRFDYRRYRVELYRCGV